MDPLRDFPGCNTAAYFAARGVDLSPEQSRGMVVALLRLVDLGALSGAHVATSRGSSPKTPATAGVSCAGRGDGAGRESAASLALEGPTVYNVGPSQYIGAAQ